MTPSTAALLAGAISLAGRGLSWLTTGGALAAATVGTAVLAGRGIRGAILLALFFVSGSSLSQLASKANRADGSRGRNARQVLANGGWAALAAVLPPWSGGWALYAGALAAAQADTWATEIGAHSRSAPRMLTTGLIVPAGTSGGITRLGTIGGLAGALLMGLAALCCSGRLSVGVAAAAGGIVGLFFDSLLGATAQAVYFCDSCMEETETPVHTCGMTVRKVRGAEWLDNDCVNLGATGVGAATALCVWLLAVSYPS